METASKVLVVLALLGGGAIYYGASNLLLTSRCSEAPEPIRLSDLLERDLEGNRYVSVTDYETGKTVLTAHNKDAPHLSGDVYIPIFAKGGDPKRVVLLKMSRFEAQFSFDPRQPVAGLVESNELSDEAKSKLAKSYPGSDFDSAVVLAVGDKPRSRTFGWGFVGLGAALILPLVCFAFWVVKRNRTRQQPQAAPEPDRAA
jgi:hypothetical protein